MPPDDWDFGQGEKPGEARPGEAKPEEAKPGEAKLAEPSPIQVEAEHPARRFVVLGIGLALAVGVLVAAIAGLSGGSDNETASATVDTGPGPIASQTVPRRPTTEGERPSVPNTITAVHPQDSPVIPGGGSVDENQVHFVAENWVNFARSRNLGAFCIFMSERFRNRLTRSSGVNALSNCVQGRFPKLTLGRRLLPLRRVAVHGSVARVTFGGGQVAILRKQKGSWKVDAFRR